MVLTKYKNRNKKLALFIDGSSMLMTAYYGSAPKRLDNESDEVYYKRFMQTSTGKYTNAIKTMLTTILNLIETYNPEIFAVAFDKSRNTFRRKLFSDYKGTRSETPSPLKEQIVSMQQILKEIGIPVFASSEYEADDIIYSLVSKYRDNDNYDVVVISKDHDYYQMIGGNVVMWAPQISVEKTNAMFDLYRYPQEGRNEFPYKMFPLDEETVFSETGVSPIHIVDLKGLTGDKSDNIPGVKGIASAAAPLIEEYGSIENIYNALEENPVLFDVRCKEIGIKRSPVKSLSVGKEEAFLSKKLATMINVPEVENIKLTKTYVNIEALKKILNAYEMKSILEGQTLLKLVSMF